MTGGLSISGLRFSYGSTCILDDLSLAIGPGEVCAVIGQSGSGKTTLIRCLLQLEHAAAGNVTYGDGNVVDFANGVANATDIDLVRKHIGYVPQSSLLLPHLSACRNVMLPLVKAHGYTKADAAARAAASLESVGVGGVGERPPWRLSGGQQQRVAIARALAIEPKLFLLDEPTAALDAGTSRVVGDVLRTDVRARHASALIVTHNLGFARLACDSIALLSEGKIAWHLRTGEVELESAIMALA